MIDKTISHHKILDKLGGGGIGVVYKAHDTKLERDVALKFLPHHLTATKDEQARVLQEARAESSKRIWYRSRIGDTRGRPVSAKWTCEVSPHFFR